jgi:hypothetical protein
MTNTSFTLALLSIAAVATSCTPSPQDLANDDDPIKALQSTVPSTRYAEQYWFAQRRANSPIWKQAVAWCTPEHSAQSPNCERVLANVRAARGNAHADSVLRAVGASVAH